MNDDIPAPEFHRPFPAERVKRGVLEERVEATPEECMALAHRMMIPAMRSLSCVFSFTPQAGGVIAADGVLKARVARVCVITLEEFDTRLEERFRVRFVPAARLASESDAPGRANPDEDPESDDELAYDGGIIDLGEVAAEQLALTLDPYPRKLGATLPELDAEEERSPFAALARLQPKPF
jgi:hypothetical protein